MEFPVGQGGGVSEVPQVPGDGDEGEGVQGVRPRVRRGVQHHLPEALQSQQEMCPDLPDSVPQQRRILPDV